MTQRGRQLQAFKDSFNPAPHMTYYPFCGGNSEPWEVFGKNVLGVARSSAETDHLRTKGVGSAVVAEVAKFIPLQKPDLLLVLGWSWDESMVEMAKRVKPKGHIVTDSFLAAATVLGNLKSSVSLVGHIDKNADVETDSRIGNKPTALGILQHMVQEHEGARPIVSIGTAPQSRPELYMGSMLVMQSQP